MQFKKKAFTSLLLVVMLALTTVGTVFANSISGPSSSQSPYILRSQPGVVTQAILTVGDSVNLKPYRMAGIPDGLGAFDNGDGTFTLLMNHEIPSGLGIVRTHGAPGAFASKWIIRTEDLTVLHGEDLIQNVLVWNKTTSQYEPATVSQKTFLRFCSADLPALSAFYDAGGGL
jgi:hypothetical protein